MQTKNLEAFLAVAKLLNFGAAARTLNYSQSTVSEQVHDLETHLKTKLFERMGRKVFLTEQGRKLLPYAERIVKDTELLQTLFTSDGVPYGTVVVGAAETLCAFWLPPILKSYRRLYPQVQIHLRVGNCIEFPQWLQQNIVDVAFGLYDESGQPHLRHHTLFQGETTFIAAPDHELAAQPEIKLQQLAGQTLLLPEGDCGYPSDLKHFLDKQGVVANPILEFGSLESIKQCVKNGLGISFLPKMVVEEEVKRGELVSLFCKEVTISIQAQMLFHREKWLSPALTALEELILAKTNL